MTTHSRVRPAAPLLGDGYVASITADALVKSQTSGVPEKVVTGGTPDFYKK